MKIEVTIYDKPYCEISADIDYEQAIAVWEWMEQEKFRQLFSLSIVDAIKKQAETSKEASVIMEMIKKIAEIKYLELLQDESVTDSQELFDEFFLKLITNEIQFIPLS